MDRVGIGWSTINQNIAVARIGTLTGHGGPWHGRRPAMVGSSGQDRDGRDGHGGRMTAMEAAAVEDRDHHRPFHGW